MCVVTTGICDVKAASTYDCISNTHANSIQDIEANPAELATTLKDRFLCGFSQDEILTLARFTPELDSLLSVQIGTSTRITDSGHDDADVANPPDVHQFNALLRRSLRTVTSEYPLVLCLFELPCADVYTLKMVECIAFDEQQTNFVVLVTYNDREIPEDHPISLWKLSGRERLPRTRTCLT